MADRHTVPDTSLVESAAEHTHKKRLTSFLRWWNSPRLTASSVAVAIALIAVAVAIAAWLRPAHEGASPSFSSQQSAQAKKNVCSAHATVRRAVFERSVNPRPDDPVAKLEVGTNRQLALVASAVHLHDILATEPAAPADLANAVNSVANTLEHLALNNLARAAKQVQSQLWRDFASYDGQVNKLCK